MLRSVMLQPHTRLYGVVLVLVTAAMVWTLGLAGCGSGNSTPIPQGDTTGSDVLLFPSEEAPLEKVAQARRTEAKDLDITPKATFNTLGTYQYFAPAETAIDYHKFWTNNNTIYIIELCPTDSALDDLDLYVGRDPNPWSNWDFVRASWAPLPDNIVFKSNRQGWMYMAVEAWADGNGDGSCPYVMHVRCANTGSNTG